MNDQEITEELGLQKCPSTGLWWSEKMPGFWLSGNNPSPWIDPACIHLNQATFGNCAYERKIAGSLAQVWLEDAIKTPKALYDKVAQDFTRDATKYMGMYDLDEVVARYQPRLIEFREPVDFLEQAIAAWSRFRKGE